MSRGLGIFGGTFDPVHRGHLAIARAVRDSFRLPRMLLVPARHPPHKGPDDLTPFGHRLAMVEEACRDHSGLEASGWEGARPGPSYTVETLAHFRGEVGPATPLFFVLGADSLSELHTWREPHRVLELAHLIVAPRPGADRVRVESEMDSALRARIRVAEESEGPPPDASGGIFWVEMDLQAISAREIRKALREGNSLSGLVPRSVAAYISRYHLYGGDEVS